MRKLLGFLLLLVAVACGGWFVWAGVMDRGLSGWLEARRADGWAADASAIETTGFPAQFQTRIENLNLADPETGLAWQISELLLRSDSLRPTDITAILPDSFHVASPLERIQVRSETLNASLAVDPAPDLGLKRADVTLGAIELSSTSGWDAALESGGLLLARAGDDPLTQQITFTAQNLRPAQPLRLALDPTGLMPEIVETLQLNATARFDREWDRRAIEERRPQITNLDLQRVEAVWGAARLEVAGTLDVDENGIPTGRITVRATNWRDMLTLAENAGLVPEPFVQTVENVLEGLAGLGGRPDTIDTPLTFQNGLVSFGPFPLGRAPRLVIR